MILPATFYPLTATRYPSPATRYPLPATRHPLPATRHPPPVEKCCRSVFDKPVSNVWFKKTPMGKTTIDSIMKKMKLNSPLIDLCPEKNIPTIVPERL